MENRCCKCVQEECPRCFERFKKRLEWIRNLVKSSIDVLILWGVARIAYRVGVAAGREENSNEDQEGEDSTDNEEDSTDDEEDPTARRRLNF